MTFLNTNRGFVFDLRLCKENANGGFTQDVRWAYPFESFEEADKFGKEMQQQRSIKYYCIMSPTAAQNDNLTYTMEGVARLWEQEGGYCSPSLEIEFSEDAPPIDFTTWLEENIFGGPPRVAMRITVELTN